MYTILAISISFTTLLFNTIFFHWEKDRKINIEYNVHVYWYTIFITWQSVHWRVLLLFISGDFQRTSIWTTYYYWRKMYMNAVKYVNKCPWIPKFGVLYECMISGLNIILEKSQHSNVKLIQLSPFYFHRGGQLL